MKKIHILDILLSITLGMFGQKNYIYIGGERCETTKQWIFDLDESNLIYSKGPTIQVVEHSDGGYFIISTDSNSKETIINCIDVTIF